MSKKLTIDAVAERSGMTKKDVENVLNHLAAHAEQELLKGHDVVLPILGKLEVKATSARVGRNPATGESVDIPAGKKVKFTVAGPFKKAVTA
jgi:DNA-binding protein HU-beta